MSLYSQDIDVSAFAKKARLLVLGMLAKPPQSLIEKAMHERKEMEIVIASSLAVIQELD